MHPSNRIEKEVETVDPFLFTLPALDERDRDRDDVPVWLQTGMEMKLTTSRMNYETISFHIFDPGYGPTALVTFREADMERNLSDPTMCVPTTNEIYSSGVLGRLLCSIRRKILEVVYIIMSHLLFSLSYFAEYVQ